MVQPRNDLDSEHRPPRPLWSWLVAALVTAVAATVSVPATAVGAASANSTQAVTATVVAGTLTVTAPPALVTNLTPGTTNTGIALGSLSYSNTLNDNLGWSVTISSTSWINGAKVIPFTGMTVSAGTPITGAAGSWGRPAWAREERSPGPMPPPVRRSPLQ